MLPTSCSSPAVKTKYSSINSLNTSKQALSRLMAQQYVPEFQKQLKHSMLLNKKTSLTSSRSMAGLMESYYSQNVDQAKTPKAGHGKSRFYRKSSQNWRAMTPTESPTIDKTQKSEATISYSPSVWNRNDKILYNQRAAVKTCSSQKVFTNRRPPSAISRSPFDTYFQESEIQTSPDVGRGTRRPSTAKKSVIQLRQQIKTEIASQVPVSALASYRKESLNSFHSRPATTIDRGDLVELEEAIIQNLSLFKGIGDHILTSSINEDDEFPEMEFANIGLLYQIKDFVKNFNSSFGLYTEQSIEKFKQCLETVLTFIRSVNLKLERAELKDVSYIVNTIAKVFIMMMDFYFQRMTAHYEQQVFSMNELLLQHKREHMDELQRVRAQFLTRQASLKEQIHKLEKETHTLREENTELGEKLTQNVHKINQIHNLSRQEKVITDFETAVSGIENIYTQALVEKEKQFSALSKIQELIARSAYQCVIKMSKSVQTQEQMNEIPDSKSTCIIASKIGPGLLQQFNVQEIGIMNEPIFNFRILQYIREYNDQKYCRGDFFNFMIFEGLQNFSGNKVRALQEVITLSKSSFQYQKNGNQFATMARFLLTANNAASLHQILLQNQKEILVRFFLGALQKDLETLRTNSSFIEAHHPSIKEEQTLSLLDFYTLCFEIFDPYTGHLANKVIQIQHSLMHFLPENEICQTRLPLISEPFTLVQFYCNAQKSVSKQLFKDDLFELIKAKLLCNQRNFLQLLAQDIAAKGISPNFVKKEWFMNYLKSKYESVLSAIENWIICERLFAFDADHLSLKQIASEIEEFENYVEMLQSVKISLQSALSASYLGLHFHFKKTIIRYLSIFKRFDKVESGIHKLNKFNHFFQYFKLISPNMTIIEANKLFSLTCHEKFMKKKEVKMHPILEVAAKQGYIIGLRPNIQKCRSSHHLMKSENVSIKIASPSESMDSSEKQHLLAVKRKNSKSKLRSMSIRVGGGHKPRFSILRFPKKRSVF